MEKENNIDDLKKALKDFGFNDDEMDALFEKSVEKDTDKDLEKSIEELETQLEAKKKEREITKSIDPEKETSTEAIFKSAIGILNSKLNDVSEKLEVEKSDKEDLAKSIADVNENLSNLNEMFKSFGAQPRGRRAFTSQAFLEKSTRNNEEVEQWSASKDKIKIEKAIETMIKSATSEEEKAHFENALINYNASGMPQSLESVAQDIEKANKIEIIK